MSGELASTSLLEHVAETGFRASVITTYSCYFPFYEEVVLRRLMAAGCTHNVLMVDATRCAEAFAIEELRPRRAGRDYTLIPVKVGGAFHPKLFLRFGRSKGSLLGGSHNMTLSGFGLNDEVTNVFHLEGAALRAGGAPFRQALDYLAGFVPANLPDVVEAFEGVKLGVPWLDGPLGMSVSALRDGRLGAKADGRLVWRSLRSRRISIRKACRRRDRAGAGGRARSRQRWLCPRSSSPPHGSCRQS